MKFFLTLISLASLLFACQESTLNPDLLPDGSQYFPWEVGQYTEYEVEQIIYNEFAKEDTLRYELREVVAERFMAQGGGEAVALWRYKRLPTHNEWQLDSVWTARLEENRVIRVENNHPFIKLSLPAYFQKTWDGNALNMLTEATYTLDSLQFPSELNGLSYPQTLHLTLSNESSLIAKSLHQEQYAAQIGLVYRYEEKFSYVNDLSSPYYGQDSVIRGFRYWQVATNFGKE